MEHVRIDEGVKRGRKLRHKMPERHPDLGTWKIPPDLDPNQVLQDYLTESTTSQISQRYGISRKAMVKWLRTVAPDEWKKVQVVRALCRKEESDDGLEAACDALSLARAREMLRSAQWDLERLDAPTFGQQTHVTVDISTDLGERLRRAQERTIDGVAVQLPQCTTPHNDDANSQVTDSVADSDSTSHNHQYVK